MSDGERKMVDRARTEREGEPVSGAEKGTGLKFSRFFTDPSIHPYDAIEGGWGRRPAIIYDEKGKENLRHYYRTPAAIA